MLTNNLMTTLSTQYTRPYSSAQLFQWFKIKTPIMYLSIKEGRTLLGQLVFQTSEWQFNWSFEDLLSTWLTPTAGVVAMFFPTWASLRAVWASSENGIQVSPLSITKYRKVRSTNLINPEQKVAQHHLHCILLIKQSSIPFKERAQTSLFDRNYLQELGCGGHGLQVQCLPHLSEIRAGARL